MRDDQLPSPGIGKRGHELRATVARVISQLQVAATGYSGGKHPAATSLSAFFAAASTAAGALAAAVTALRSLGAATYTTDGSVGQTYSAPAGMTGIQWYREALTSDRTKVAISGATGSTYVSTQADAGFRLVARGTRTGVLTDAVSLKVVLPAPVLLEGFESKTGFTDLNGTTVIDATAPVQGSGLLKFNGTAAGLPNATKTNIASLDPATMGVVAVYTKLGTDYDAQTCTGVDTRFGRSGTYQTVSEVTGPKSVSSPTTFVATGGFWHSFNIADVPALTALGAGQLDVRMNPSSTTPHASTPSVDCLVRNAGGRPTAILTFDDARPGQLTIGLPVMQERGLVGSLYIPTAVIGQANRHSWADLRTFEAAGWDVALDGTNDDSVMTTRANPAACVSELLAMHAALDANGIVGAGRWHLCYPNGVFMASAMPVIPSAVTGNTTTTVSMASTAGIAAGMRVIGLNVPAGTVVSSVPDSTTVILSNPVPAQTTAMKFVDASGPFHGNKLIDALKAAGFKSGRTTTAGGPVDCFHSRFGIGDRGLLLPGRGFTSQTSANMIAWVDKIIANQMTGMCYMHDILPGGGSINVSTADFTAFMDYLKGRVDAGVLDVLTLSQWWARDGGSSVPF
jgi:Polysaccharide deacetylase.